MSQASRILFIGVVLCGTPVYAAVHEDATVQYNRGTKAYKAGQFAEAEKNLSQALAGAAPRLQGRTAYNLGGTQYRQGTAAALKQPDAASGFFEQALENYRLAIRRDPRDRDAQFNYELTQKHLDAVKQEQEKQKQNQQQQPQEAESKESQEEKPEQQQTQQQEAKEEQAQEQPAQSQEAQQKEEQAQAPQPGEENPEENKDQAAGQELSKQQALWILDNVQREEYSNRANMIQRAVRESNVEQDW